MKKTLAITAASLITLTSLGATAGAASAQDRDDRDRRGGCSVELDQTRRGNDLEVSVDGPRRADTANVRLVFERDRGRDVTQWLRIDLDRRGEGDETVDIPRRADSVEATVYIRDGRRGFITCDADLDLDRRGGRDSVRA